MSENLTYKRLKGLKIDNEIHSAEGIYPDLTNEDEYLVIIGNGTKDEPSNAYMLDKDGNAVFSGNITANGAQVSTILNTYTKDETDNKIDEKVASITGGESAAEVKLALDAYRDVIDVEIWGEDAKGWTTSSTTEDGETVINYNPDYERNSRIDNIETSLKNLDANTAGYKYNNGEIFNDYENNKILNDSEQNYYAHAEGNKTTAGWRSHSEGYMTEATNTGHAEGRLAIASGKGSHAEGFEYNDFFSEGEGAILLTENVSIDNNVIKVNTIPNELTKGHTVYLTSYGNIKIRPTDVKKVINFDSVNKTITLDSMFKDINYEDSGVESSPTEIPAGAQLRKAMRTTASNLGSHAEGMGTISSGEGSHSEGNNTHASGNYSHAEGLTTKASAAASHAEGQLTTSYSQAGHAEGYGSQAGVTPGNPEIPIVTVDGKPIDTSCAHAEGNGTKAYAFASHAEGNSTTASGSRSHSEGMNSTASGSISHAEGNSTTASGNNSHAEGLNSTSSGNQSHAEGWRTIAASENQHVQGKCNIEDAANKYAHIVGNGTSDTNRSNAHTLDWSGNAWFAGNIYVGGTQQSEGVQIAPPFIVNFTLLDTEAIDNRLALSTSTSIDKILKAHLNNRPIIATLSGSFYMNDITFVPIKLQQYGLEYYQDYDGSIMLMAIGKIKKAIGSDDIWYYDLSN